MGRRVPTVVELVRAVGLPQLWQQNRARVGLVVCGVAVGTALTVAIGIINASILQGFQETLRLLAGPSDLTVTLGHGEIGFPEDMVERVREDPDVRAAIALVRGTVTLADDPSRVLVLFGADLLAEHELERYRIRLKTSRRDAEKALLDLRSVFVTERFAEQLALRVGDQIPLDTPAGRQSLMIRGLLEPEGVARAFSGHVIVTDIAAAQWLLHKERLVDQIDLVLREGASLDGAKVRIQERLGPNLLVEVPLARGKLYENAFTSFQTMLTALSLLCLIAGFFIIYNTTSTAALQRSTAISTLRLLGATDKQILGLLLSEAAVFGIVGATIGLCLGVPLAFILSGTITQSMGVIFQLRLSLQELTLPLSRLLALGAIGVGVAVGGSWFAARRMAGLDPLDHIRTGAFTAGEVVAPSRLFTWWVSLITVSILAFLIEARLHSIAWGNFGSTLWNASIIVITVPLLSWLAPMLANVLERFFGAAGEVAAHSIMRAPTRSGITAAAIALILTIAVMLSSLVLSCRESLRSYFRGVLSADLTVSAVSTEGGWLETPLPKSIAEELRAIPGVKQVESARALTGQEFRGNRVAVLALGEGLLSPSRVPDGWYREGAPTDAARRVAMGNAALVSESFADRFDVHLDDTIRLNSPGGVVEFVVAGVVPEYVSDRGSVIMSDAALGKFWKDRSANRFLVFLEPRADIEAVRSLIEEKLARRYRLKILDLQQLLAYHTDLIDRAFSVMHSIQLLIIIVTIAGIFDLLVSRVIERQRELALWRVVGAREGTVRRSVVIEACVIGLFGAALGLVTGFASAWLWVGVHFRELLGYYVAYHFDLFSALWYVALVLCMTMLTGYVASGAAARMPLLEAIRND